MPPPELSICIPTYNRAAYLGETLDSIVAQGVPDIEVVVSDNASADDTEALVRRYQAVLPNLVYFRWPENMGADRNYLKVIQLASSRHCWFMGSDDLLESGAVPALLERLRADPTVAGLSVNRHAYSPDMKHRIFERPVAGGGFDGDRVFRSAEDTFAALGEYFGYLPGQVVDRELWNEVLRKFDVTPYFNAYVHVYVIARMLQMRPHWRYIDHHCVGWRSGNDSFLSGGLYKRLAIDVVGYEQIARDVFGRSSGAYDALMNTVATVHVKAALLRAKAQNAPTGFFVRALKLCTRAYWRYPRYWLRSFPIFLLPRSAFLAVRAVYRVTLKPSRLRRAGVG
jgi:abequosyltransferase